LNWARAAKRSRGESNQFFGFGDQAAALAGSARAKNGNFAASCGVFTSSIVFASSGFSGPATSGDKQHGLMM
jgi:hypothetical protein